MLLIPPTLGLVHQLKFILEQPFVICALDNRSRLARNLLAALLFIAFRAVMAVSIPSIALGALLFRGSKPCTWESGASYYAYMTGQTLITPVKTGSLIVWQAKCAPAAASTTRHRQQQSRRTEQAGWGAFPRIAAGAKCLFGLG